MNHAQAYALAVGVAGTAMIGGVGLRHALTNDHRPKSIGEPVALLATKVGPLGLTGPAGCTVTFTVPGKPWGGVMHWSPTILKPTLVEHVCVSYPGVGTVATIKVMAP